METQGQNLSEMQIAGMREAFSRCDRDGDGFIEASELKMVVSPALAMELSEQDMHQLVSGMHVGHRGLIQWNDLLSGVRKWVYRGSTTTRPEPSSKVVLKCTFEGESRVLEIPKTFGFTDLKRGLQAKYGRDLLITYYDGSGGRVPLDSQAALKEAVSQHIRTGASVLKVHLVDINDAPLASRPVVPKETPQQKPAEKKPTAIVSPTKFTISVPSSVIRPPAFPADGPLDALAMLATKKKTQQPTQSPSPKPSGPLQFNTNSFQSNNLRTSPANGKAFEPVYPGDASDEDHDSNARARAKIRNGLGDLKLNLNKLRKEPWLDSFKTSRKYAELLCIQMTKEVGDRAQNTKKLSNYHKLGWGSYEWQLATDYLVACGLARKSPLGTFLTDDVTLSDLPTMLHDLKPSVDLLVSQRKDRTDTKRTKPVSRASQPAKRTKRDESDGYYDEDDVDIDNDSNDAPIPNGIGVDDEDDSEDSNPGKDRRRSPRSVSLVDDDDRDSEEEEGPDDNYSPLQSTDSIVNKGKRKKNITRRLYDIINVDENGWASSYLALVKSQEQLVGDDQDVKLGTALVALSSKIKPCRWCGESSFKLNGNNDNELKQSRKTLAKALFWDSMDTDDMQRIRNLYSILSVYRFVRKDDATYEHRPERGLLFTRGDKERSIQIHNHNTRTNLKKPPLPMTAASLHSRSSSPPPVLTASMLLKTSHSAPSLLPHVHQSLPSPLNLSTRKRLQPMRSLPPSPTDDKPTRVQSPELKTDDRKSMDLPLKKRKGADFPSRSSSPVLEARKVTIEYHAGYHILHHSFIIAPDTTFRQLCEYGRHHWGITSPSELQDEHKASWPLDSMVYPLASPMAVFVLVKLDGNELPQGPEKHITAPTPLSPDNSSGLSKFSNGVSKDGSEGTSFQLPPDSGAPEQHFEDGDNTWNNDITTKTQAITTTSF